MRKLFVLAAVLVLFSAGCAEAEEAVRQLFFPEVEMLGQMVETPAWFYPGDGTVEYLCDDCGNGIYGEDCPFYKFDGSYSLAEDTLYYFHSGDLCAFDTEKGRGLVLIAGNDPRMLERNLFKGEYLYTYDPASAREDGHGYAEIKRIHLPDMRTEDINGQGLVWKIMDGVGYYVIADSSPYIVSGLYRQPLYTAEEVPPAKELLLHEVELGIYPVLTEDAIYWIGNDRLEENPDVVTHNLYRYDLKKQSIILVAEAFGVGRMVSDGEYLYTVRRQEDRDTLIRTDDYGNITVLSTAEEGQRMSGASADIVDRYVIVDMVSDKADGIMKTGKLVYDTESGEVQTYWLQEREVS